MAKFTAVWPDMLLHRAGCRDLKKTCEAQNQTFEASSVADALSVMIDEELIEMGWSEDDVKVFPCCGK